MCIDIWAPQSRGFKRFILYKHSSDQDKNVFPHSRIPRIHVHSYWGPNVLIQYLGLVASFRLGKNIIGRCWLLQPQYLLGKILQSKLVTFSCALYIVLRNSQVFVIWLPSIMCEEESDVVVFTIGTRMRILCLSLSQTQPQPGHFYYVCFIFHVCFSYVVSLIKTINNYCYWKCDWILFHSRNIDISFFGWGWTREFLRCLAQPQPRHLCVYFLNETISSQIASNNNKLWSLLNLLHRKNIHEDIPNMRF